MSEQVQEQPASRNPFARLIGVITSPTETFEEIARHPGWVAPFLTYLTIFAVAFSLYSMKADWIAIMTQQIEGVPFMSMLPEEQIDKAIKDTTDGIRRMSPVQVTMQQLLQIVTGFPVFFHFTALVYATLFVLMGSLPTLRLGRAWLNFLLCLLVFAGYLAVTFVANAAFKDSPGSALLLTGTAAVVMVGGYLWLLNRHALGNVEFHKMLSATTYSSAVPIIAAFALMAVTAASPPPIVTPADRIVPSHLGAVLKPDIAVLRKLLEWLNVLTIWWLAVLAIGYRVLTRLPMGVAVSVTFLPWAVFVLISLAMTAVFG